MSVQKLWMRIWPKHLWVLFFVVISPAAFLIPNDVFSQYPWTRTYAEWLAKGIPMIDRAAHLHPHPEKFKVFFAYAWSCMPVFLVVTWFGDAPRMKAALLDLADRKPGLTVLLFLTLVFALWNVIYVPGQMLGSLQDMSQLMNRQEARSRLYSSDTSLFLYGVIQTCGSTLVAVSCWHALCALQASISAIKTPGQEDQS